MALSMLDLFHPHELLIRTLSMIDEDGFRVVTLKFRAETRRESSRKAVDKETLQTETQAALHPQREMCGSSAFTTREMASEVAL